MGNHSIQDQSLDTRMADRLKALRSQQGWSLDELSKQCGISRATLSRLENAEVSPTASVLGKLCSTYQITMSRLMAMVEADFAPFIPRDQQARWEDPDTGFVRTMVSPPAQALRAELLECLIPAGKRIEYSKPPRPGLEHHIFVLEGYLELSIDGQLHQLHEGDCLRYQLHGPSIFETEKDSPAKYILIIL